MLEIIKFILTVMPMILDLVKKIEEVAPESGLGKEKLQLVRASLESADNVADEVKDNWPLIERLVGLSVGFMKLVGVFK